MTRWWVSDCGQYLARCRGAGDFDVYSIDGERGWLSPRYKARGLDDQDPRLLYPEFAGMVGSYHAYVGRHRGVDRFRLRWSDHDQAMRIDPFRGNTITKEYTATFSRQYRMRKAKPLVEYLEAGDER